LGNHDALAPNSWRLSGAEGVRCSRGFGDGALALLLRNRRAPEDTCHAEIFIDIRPVDAFTVTQELPVQALGG
jgi:hypothetical protein